LDAHARNHFWHLLDAKRTGDTTLIVTTHLAEDVAHCDVVSQCLEGRIESTSPVVGSTNGLQSLLTP